MTLIIPPTLTFADLALERAADGRLLFLPVPLAVLISQNGGDADAALLDEDFAMHWIAQWYLAHRETGGDVDPVAERILADLTPTQVQ